VTVPDPDPLFLLRRADSLAARGRVLIHRLGLAVPDLQGRVRRRDGSVMARCDPGWEEHRTVGEFDGQVEYGRLLRPGQEPGEVVCQEKRREDELRDHRWQVARWTWDDLDRPRAVGGRLLRAFAWSGR
jgi:hypothetical protein